MLTATPATAPMNDLDKIIATKGFDFLLAQRLLRATASMLLENVDDINGQDTLARAANMRIIVLAAMQDALRVNLTLWKHTGLNVKIATYSMIEVEFTVSFDVEELREFEEVIADLLRDTPIKVGDAVGNVLDAYRAEFQDLTDGSYFALRPGVEYSFDWDYFALTENEDSSEFTIHHQ